LELGLVVLVRDDDALIDNERDDQHPEDQDEPDDL